MNAKLSVFVISVEANIYLLLYNLHDCTFKATATSVRYFARGKFLGSLVYKNNFGSFQVRILIFQREVGCLF